MELNVELSFLLHHQTWGVISSKEQYRGIRFVNLWGSAEREGRTHPSRKGKAKEALS